MSALYLKGLKQGDIQMTASGLLSAALFFFLSLAQPLQNISEKRPPKSVFNLSILCSIIGQFIIHLISLVIIFQLSSHYQNLNQSVSSTSTVIDGKFKPNLVNTSVYLLNTLIQVNNFVINYRGYPFTQSIQENQLMWRSVQIFYLLLLVVVGGQFEPLNDLLQLSSFPSTDYQIYLVILLAINTVLCYTIEKISQIYE
jgi:cation-transporting ATPase 13A1